MSAPVRRGGVVLGPTPSAARRPAHELVEVAHQAGHVERAGHVVGVHARHLGVALVLGLGQPRARVEAELAERLAAPLRLRERAVGLAHLRRGLLVVDVLELEEDAVAGGQHAAGDRLAAAARADPQLDVGRGQLALVGAERPLGLDLDRVLDQALQLDLGLELEVGAADLARERLVEQVLDALLVLPAAARDERARAESTRRSNARRRTRRRIVGELVHFRGTPATLRHHARCSEDASVQPYRSPSRWPRPLLAAAPAQAGQVIVVDGNHAKRVNDPDVPSKAEIALPPAGGPSVPRLRQRAARRAPGARAQLGQAARRPARRLRRAQARAALQADRTRPPTGAGAAGTCARCAPTGTCAARAATSSAT